VIIRFSILLWTALFFWAPMASAQGAQVAFGTVQDNSDLPIEVTSDSLAVDQNAGTAIFTDNVIAVQGEMRLTADEVTVFYDTVTSDIVEVVAVGNVILISGPDAAESENAVYDVNAGTIVMTGDVLVTQGPSALTSDKMTIQIDDGTAQMNGRVRTVLQQDQ